MDERTQLDWVKRTYGRGEARKFWTDKRDRGLRPQEQALVLNHLKDRGAAILNIGCGSGRETFALYELGFHKVCGVDVTPELLAAARERCKRDSIDIPFYEAPGGKLPFPDGAFDAATMFYNVYGHIVPRTFRLQCLTEIRRVLKPEGLLLFDVNSHYVTVPHWIVNSIRNLARRVYNPRNWEIGDKTWATQARNKLEKRSQLVCSHVFRPCEIARDASETGFIVVQATAVRDIVRNSSAQSRFVLNKGPLVYALRRAP